jgi:hypothetical protein
VAGRFIVVGRAETRGVSAVYHLSQQGAATAAPGVPVSWRPAPLHPLDLKYVALAQRLLEDKYGAGSTYFTRMHILCPCQRSLRT